MGEKRWSYPDDDTGRVLSLMAENGFPMDRAMKGGFGDGFASFGGIWWGVQDDK
ncbi:MAG: hypothetical protein ACXWK4_07250 [Myxococcaceae bacterium]